MYGKPPKTLFNMRGNLLHLDIKMLEYWKNNNIMQSFFMYDSKKPTKLLISGPPYANGALHTGHKINFILKDLYVHWWRGQGYNVSHLSGFDCHGRPIEQKINPTINANSEEQDIIKHIDLCRQLALNNITTQYDQLTKLNIFLQQINHHKYYATLNEYVSIYEAFSNLLLNGYVYAQQRPMIWSTEDASVISEIETEYKTKISTSVYVALQVYNTHDYIIIWTTTPWTLIDNAAVCYNSKLKYVAIKYGNTRYIICNELINSFIEKTKWKDYTIEHYTINENIFIYHPVIDNKLVQLYAGDHVTSDIGTGFVHTAPAHGIEDFEVYLKYKNTRPFTFTESVNPRGYYYDHVPKLANLHIFKNENDILETIKNKIIIMEKYEHNYLFAQRSNEPIIYRASNQIFADLSSLSFEKVKEVFTTPDSLNIGLYNYVKERKEWCLSRNRTWGVPLALLIHKQTNKIYINDKFQQEILKQMNINPYLFLCNSKFTEFVKKHVVNYHEYDLYLGVLDVWFDSACAYDIVTKLLNLENYPSTFIEGIDQKRGWFQSSLLARLLQNKSLPYNEIISHGFVVDGQGRKLSKSLGNADEINDIISQYGNEILRIRMVECDYTSEITLSAEIMENCANTYRKIRNVLRYLISACETYKLTKHVFINDLPELELIYYYKLNHVMNVYKEYMNKYKFNDAFAILIHFITDISSNYFNACKNNLYEKSDEFNAHTIFLLNKMLICLLNALKCILTSTCEEVYLYMKNIELNYLWRNIFNNNSIHTTFIDIKSILNHDKLLLNDEFIKNYENVCAIISKRLASENITTGYEKNYDMYIHHCGIKAETLKNRFNVNSVIFNEQNEINFVKINADI